MQVAMGLAYIGTLLIVAALITVFSDKPRRVIWYFILAGAVCIGISMAISTVYEWELLGYKW